MKHERTLSRKLAISLWLPIMVVVLILIVGVSIVGENKLLGFGIIALAAVYLVVVVVYYEYLEKQVIQEMLGAGFEQSQVQKHLLQNMPVPYIVTNDKGNQIWFNTAFEKHFGSKGSKKNINQMFPEIYKKVFPSEGGSKQYRIIWKEKKYRVECNSIVLDQLSGLEGTQDGEVLLAFYFFDETQLLSFMEENKKKNLAAGLIYIDNYEEVLEDMEDVRKSLLLAIVERKIIRYMQGIDAIIKKFEKDKFMFVFEEQHVEKFRENRFAILDDVRETNVGNDLAMTLSISVGIGGGTYMETYESARMAMDLALGRGGDQAVIRDGDNTSYYGGKTQKVEKSTQVKARVKAHALRELMITHDQVFIMGHKNPDADCIGAALGIYRLTRTLNKKASIVMDENCPAIEPIMDALRAQNVEGEKIFVTNEEAKQLCDSNSILIVVDVNVPNMTEYPDLLRMVNTIVVLDHHRSGTETIKNAVVSYVEPYASSSCEMVAEILQYIPDKIKLRNVEADAIYAGILVDTDNFVIKAGVRTFEAAAYLRRSGADVTRVRKMFREDFDNVQLRAAIVSKAYIYQDEFAISTLNGKDRPGATVTGAKAANTLLGVQGIRASFVLTELNDCIYMSARSIDDINVQIIMERFGGGGHLTMAAAQLKDVTLNEAIRNLKDVLSEMKEEGEI